MLHARTTFALQVIGVSIATCPAIALAQPAAEQPAVDAEPPAPDPRLRVLEQRIEQLEARAAEAERARAADEARQASADPKGEPGEAAKPGPTITFGGYAEAYYQWNINDPSNGVTNYRGFDNRHNSLTLSNVALDGRLTYEGAEARVTLQAGQTPDTYYLAEPRSPGASGAGPASLDTWRFIQQAYAGYELHVLSGLLLQGGLFLSPIGPESIAVKDNWQWSRSNLFFGLPFYHAGARATLKADERWSVTLGLMNGWNDIVDNNPEKSGYLQLNYGSDAVAWSLLYFGGVERPEDAPEGRPWRSTFDTHLTWSANDWLKVQPHFDAGFELTDFGTSYWAAGALALQAKLSDWLYVATRADVFGEHAARDPSGEAARIFWPVDWVASQTATLEARAAEHVSLRLEYRHDHAAGAMFFAGEVAGDGVETPYALDARYQDTLTLGVTAWL